MMGNASLTHPTANHLSGAANFESKSFLFLFFKKEILPFACLDFA
jgi:hypothetical protein